MRMTKVTTQYTPPYSVTEHSFWLWNKLQEMMPDTAVSSAEYFSELNSKLSDNLTRFERFNFYTRTGTMNRYEGQFAATNLYACGCSGQQIRGIIPISLKTSLHIRATLLSSGCNGVRGKGQSPKLKGPLDLQQHVRLGLLLALCCHVRQTAGADDLQSVVSGTMAYFRLCEGKGVAPLINAAHLFAIYHPTNGICQLTAKKCTSCQRMFFEDMLAPGFTGACRCNIPKSRSAGFKGRHPANISMHH